MDIEVRELYVSAKGDRDFSEITEALEAAKRYTNAEIIIHIGRGTYRERVVVNQDNVTLMGSDPLETVITYDVGAFDINKDGEKNGTFRTPTLFIDADNFYCCNITVKNEAGQGDKAGQAIAVYADGDHLVFENCRFEGYQDTLFTAPLPHKEMQPGGFKGPKEFAPRRMGRHLYKDCYISGNVDFIFGSAIAYFDNCEIFMRDRDGDVKGYCTAPSSYENEKYGYVFNHCQFTSDCPPESAYLGRPWRNYAKCVIMNSQIGSHIKKEGWHDWNKSDAHETIVFAEYNNTGEGAGSKESRADYVKFLSDKEASMYTQENVLGF